jgi:N-acetylmuramic acid 6-phosphate etherase
MVAEFILGVDGGGTKTTALVASATGRVLGRGTAGSSNLHAVGEAEALDALRVAIAEAYAAAQLPPRLPRAACLGLAGVARPTDQGQLRAWAEQALPGVAIRIVNDAELVLAAGTPEGWGIAVISGTGSIAFGRSPDGRIARAGGWGWALGDEGSGYAIGLAALRAVARAADGRGPRTTLTEAILARWSLAGPEALVGEVYRTPFPRAEISALATLVEVVADEGDEVALTILRDSGWELALAATSVARALEFTGPTPGGLAGGVLVNGHWVRTAFAEVLAEAGLWIDPVQSVAEPVLGAIVLARRMLARRDEDDVTPNHL